ncbi:MAG: hypothetical protein MRERC_3c071 [Mycoplasmataceae bacterium RC_NB112A]|nr:MAG: hypothetical protein MRERC_3c071 [Mycoplasmataceae bacterium RC_NB112A]
MSEFKIKCWYYGERKNKFFKDKEKQIYHKFNVDNAKDLPDKFFRSLWRNEFNERRCWLWVSNELIKQANINLEEEKDYCFLVKLGEFKTAAFNIKDNFSYYSNNVNNMVLKSKEYFQNTIQKIGFWDSKDYFYEVNKKQSKKPNSLNSNNNKWVKIILIISPILVFILLLLILVKWMRKKQKTFR